MNLNTESPMADYQGDQRTRHLSEGLAREKWKGEYWDTCQPLYSTALISRLPDLYKFLAR